MSYHALSPLRNSNLPCFCFSTGIQFQKTIFDLNASHRCGVMQESASSEWTVCDRGSVLSWDHILEDTMCVIGTYADFFATLLSFC